MVRHHLYIVCSLFLLTASQVCDEAMQGNGVCDRVCMTATSDFDTNSNGSGSDCRGRCLSHCAVSTCAVECDTWDCAWGGGSCGECESGCRAELIGNGVCDDVCNYEKCSYDAGDCADQANPYQVYVSSHGVSSGTGSWVSPYPSLSQALSSLYLPFNRVSLLAGTHFLRPSTSGPLLSQSSLHITYIATLFCSFRPGDHIDCATSKSIIQLTSEFTFFSINHTVIFDSIDFHGDFALKPGCSLPTCMYCPYVTLDTARNVYKNDRNEEITMSDYADHSLCDFYHDKSFIYLYSNSNFTVFNSVFSSFRQQLSSIISTECANVTLQSVTFTHNFVYPQGLNGGLISQVCPDAKAPYYCGSFRYESGAVRYLNDGYEYRKDGVFSGFVTGDGFYEFRVENVVFEYNFMAQGEKVTNRQSTMMMLQRFRTLELKDCTFRYNIASLSIAVSILHSLQIPLVLDSHHTAVDYSLTHITLSGLHFYNNSAENGTILYLNFQDEHQNVLITNCTFINNFSTIGALIYVNNDNMSTTYATGGYVNVMVGSVPMEIWLPPRYFNITNVTFDANYITELTYFENIGNVFLRNFLNKYMGDTLNHVTTNDYLLHSMIQNSDMYLSQASLSYPDQFTCQSGVVLHNIMRISIQNVNFRHNFCVFGSPGIAVFDDPEIIAFRDILFENNTGNKLISTDISTDLTLFNLTFLNNSNKNDSHSLCFSITFTQPVTVNITKATFRGNIADNEAVGNIKYAKKVVLDGVEIRENKAIFSVSGVNISPNAFQNSFISVTNSEFIGNSANFKGSLTIMDSEGNLADNFQAVSTLKVTNCVFSGNSGSYYGAGITIFDNIHVDSESCISKCEFRGNTGSAVYLSYQSGVVSVAECEFEGNAGREGVGIYAGQQPDSSLFPTYVSVTDCMFAGNSGPSITVTSASSANLLVSHSNRYLSNTASAVSLLTGLYHDTSSTYHSNTADYGAALSMSLNSLANITGSQFTSNTAYQGGAIYARFLAPAFIYNCLFRDNVATSSGGVIYTETSLNTLISNSLIVNNSAGSGSVIMSYSGLTLFESSSIISNYAYEYASFALLQTEVEISNCTISENQAAERTAGVYLTSSTLSISRTVFRNMEGENGGFIQAVNNAVIRVKNSEFVHGVAGDDGGAVFLSLGSELYVESSRFVNCTSGHLAGAIYLSKSSVIAIDVLIESTSAVLGGGIDMFDGQVTILNSTFHDVSNSAIHIDQSELLLIENSVFSHGQGLAYRGGGIYASDVVEVNVVNCTFDYNTAEMGGGVYIFSNAQGEVADHIIVTGCRFKGNRAQSGGGMLLDGVDAVIGNNTFQENTAYYVSGSYQDTNGMGGGALLRCGNLGFCKVTVENNVFDGNSADTEGGAVQWFQSPPVFTGNRFNGNKAEYGPDVASYAISIAPVTSSLQRIPYEDNSTSTPRSFTLSNFVSGQSFTSTLYFALYDHLWNRVTNDNSSILEIQVPANTTISGQFKSSCQKGVFQITDFAIIAEPGGTRNIEFVTDAIDTSLKTRYNDTARYIPSTSARLNFRLCNPGETISNGACLTCQAETYSVDPASPCKTCPTTAVCYGGFVMVPKAGYWRARNDTDVFFECLNPDACLGSEAPPSVSLTGICADGYSGNLCQVCTPGYSHTGRNMCARCPGKTANIIISILIVIVALSGIALVVGLAIRGATRPRSLMAIYFKIFLNYAQMVIVAASLSLNWPSFVKSFLSTQELVGGTAEQLFSYECLLQDFHTNDNVGIYTVKLIIAGLLPAVLILLALITWIMLKSMRKVDFLWQKLIASSVVIVFIAHPSLTKMMFSLYSCIEILPGETWILADLSEKCWTQSHLKAVYFVSIPSIVVWVLGLPTLVLGFLFKYRLKLHELTHRLKFSFLFKGYEPHFYFWEFVILYRKVAIVISAVFLSPVSVRVESLTILAVLLAAVYLQLRFQPYNDVTLNKLEIKSILVSAITIYTGLYYDTNSMNTAVNLILFVVILIANGYFLGTWVRYISPVIFVTLREKLGFLARFRRQYRVKPFQTASQDLKDQEKSSASVSSLNISSAPVEGTFQPTDELIVPANTPSRMVREGTDPEDPGLEREYSLR